MRKAAREGGMISGAEFTVRLAQERDARQVLRILDSGRSIMRSLGNRAQWTNGYPSLDDVLADIVRQQCYMVERAGEAHGSFVLQLGEEPTYGYIEGTGWLNGDPYATVHRLATLGRMPGLGRFCFSWCQARVSNLRADTHRDNAPMRHLLRAMGFQHCGVVYMADGAPREAYHWVASGGGAGVKRFIHA